MSQRRGHRSTAPNKPGKDWPPEATESFHEFVSETILGLTETFHRADVPPLMARLALRTWLFLSEGCDGAVGTPSEAEVRDFVSQAYREELAKLKGAKA